MLTTDAQRGLEDVFASESAFRAWYDETLPRVYGYLLARTGGDVALTEDLTQTTYLEAVRGWRRFAGDSAVATWLVGIARHKLVDHYRKAERANRFRPSVREIEPVGDTGDWMAHEQRDEIDRVLARLPGMQRAALVLHYMDDLPVREVSRLLGKSEKAVESLLSRGRGEFRRLHAEPGAREESFRG